MNARSSREATSAPDGGLGAAPDSRGTGVDDAPDATGATASCGTCDSDSSGTSPSEVGTAYVPDAGGTRAPGSADAGPDRPRSHASPADLLGVEPHPVEELLPAGRDSTSTGSIPRIGVALLVLAAAWLAVSAVRSLQGIVGPLLLVINLVIVAYPVQARLNKAGVPRIFGAIVSGLIVFAIVVTFFGSLAWSMALLVQEIPQYQQQFSALYQSALDQLARVGVSETQAMAQLQAQLNPTRIVGFATSTLSGLTGALTLLLVTVTIVFVVLIDSMSLPKRLEVAGRTHADIVAALTGFAQGVRRYWVVSSVFGAIVAVLDVLALWYLGVPLAIVWGLLSFLTNYIPNIGFVIGIVPPTLMALLANDPWTALMVVVAYCVINFVIQSIIQPKFLGDAVGVTATVSLLSLLFWAWVLGPLGALLALPATLLCKALFVDLDPRVRWLDAFIASRPDDGNQLRKGRQTRRPARAASEATSTPSAGGVTAPAGVRRSEPASASTDPSEPD